MLNKVRYAYIYLDKQSYEYVKILNVSNAVHSIRPLYKSLSRYRDRRIQNTASSVAAFRKMNNAAYSQKFFRAGEVLWN